MPHFIYATGAAQGRKERGLFCFESKPGRDALRAPAPGGDDDPRAAVDVRPWNQCSPVPVPIEVATGVFGARMAVELVNDGPVTIVLGG
jgi:hypothetical protein